MPERRGHGRARDQEEWEPDAALMGAMQEARLPPGPSREASIAALKPQLEEALGALSGLERRRSLSERERTRAEALRMLLASIERARR